MKTSIEIAGSVFEPGTSGIANIPVARMPRGDLLQIPVRVVNGAEPGPVLGLESGTHGDEACAIQTIHSVVEEIDPQTLRGAVVAIPVSNPVAFESYTRLTLGLAMTDEVNVNLAFPGAGSQASLASRLAHALTSHFVPLLDYLVHFHSAGLESAIEYTLVMQSGGPLSDRILELSRVFGSDLLSINKIKPGGTGSLSELAETRGIPTVTTMLGGSYLSSTEHTLTLGHQGVLNLMRHLDMLDGEPVVNPRQRIIGQRTLRRHETGGVFIPVLGLDRLGDEVPAGTVIGEVRDPYTNEVLEQYTAPHPRTILIMMRGIFGRVFPGDYAYVYGNADDVYEPA